ncbi:Nucleic acid-binding, OB-fold [Cynara cardunculus var. scolymus]|uniref:Translation initiation factor IF-1, chloroplastic n=2 Tax=Cynara cardunculus var. scolymus TaxID=59895 RepID=A0A118JRI9_CYNCS|nr:Nucleic acid-binding, OB-fold [Cynara cardunculus var. scolymus]
MAAASTTFGPPSSPLLLNTIRISPPPLTLTPTPPCSAFFPSSTRLPVVRAIGKPRSIGNPSKSKPSESSEQKWVAKGLITESLPNGMFWVRLENGDVVLGYVSGKIRRNSIRMLPGDKVKIEVSRYDSTRGRIVYRIGSKDV